MDPALTAQEVQDMITKAVTQTTYTMDPPARSIYSPENLDPSIKVIAPTTTPVRNALPRTQGFGQAASFNMITSRLDPAAGGTGTKVGFADAGQPNATTQTTVFTSYPYKNLGRDVEIGRQQIAANRGSNLEDIRASQEMIKTLEVVLGEENLLLNGNKTAEPLEFDGLNTLITTNSGTAGLLTASGVSGYSRTLYNAGSELVSHLILNPFQSGAMSNQLEGGGSIQRVVSVDGSGAAQAIVGSHLKAIVDGTTGNLIQAVTSRFANSWSYLLSAKSAAGENYIEVEDLEKLSIYDVPTSNHSIQSRVYETTVLKLIGEVFQYKIGGLATS